MPSALTFPGIYIEEIPSGVRTITGVSASNTVFVDYFARGPMNTPVRITSYAEFERMFGGLHPDSEASYGIQQYYLNGGSVAFVVRVAAGNPKKAEVTLQSGSPSQDTLIVRANAEGTWVNNAVEVAVVELPNNRFNLFVRQLELEAYGTRGVWKAPAGTEALLRNVSLDVVLTDGQNGGLNPLGLNVLRNFPILCNVAWGARTLDGAGQKASEWKYIPVRRTALFIEESLFQALKWVVFEPNDEPLCRPRLKIVAVEYGPRSPPPEGHGINGLDIKGDIRCR